MPLLGISVIGPLSECSSSVRVEGQISGATVAIFMTSHAGSIGGGVSSWSDQSFSVSVPLVAGQTVFATQIQGAQTSPPGPGSLCRRNRPPSDPWHSRATCTNAGNAFGSSGPSPART